ncbi:unnamed protein product [Brassica napus]|uniref:(rape) hypothetical protein n=1 Tax=Brassica napus TaxID=3708 RepID=A0A816U478_BRANA|nr:unnamed protein product [Brassica napus]
MKPKNHFKTGASFINADIDEAIIRRSERRIMVGLPPMTDGYSGSDLKNFCTTAAYRPVRELIKH